MAEIESNHLLSELNMLMFEWMWMKLADKKSDQKKKLVISCMMCIHICIATTKFVNCFL